MLLFLSPFCALSPNDESKLKQALHDINVGQKCCQSTFFRAHFAKT